LYLYLVQLTSIKHSYLEHIQDTLSSGNLIDISNIQELLENFKNLSPGLSLILPVFFILDYTARQYLLMTDRLLEISGYHPKEFLETKMDKTLEVFHKDDFAILNDYIFGVNTDFLKKTPHEDHSRFVFSYNFRFIGADKKFVNVLQRCTYVTSPETGLPLYSIGALTDITDFKTDDVIVHTIEQQSPSCRKIVERNYYYPNEAEAQLTNREKEILLYIADGHSTKQVADKLRISENTIDNHRQNMLRKTNTKNIAELIAFTIRNKII